MGKGVGSEEVGSGVAVEDGSSYLTLFFPFPSDKTLMSINTIQNPTQRKIRKTATGLWTTRSPIQDSKARSKHSHPSLATPTPA